MSKHTREYNRAYYAANREKILARRKEWRKRNLAKCRAAESAWAAAHPEKVSAKQKRFRDGHREKLRVKNAAWARKARAANPKRFLQIDREYRQRRKLRMAADPELYSAYRAVKKAAWERYEAQFAHDAEKYAMFRAGRRRLHAKRMIMAGKVYCPLPQRRIPDWATKGGALDVRSPWLVENMTPEQAAYARELAIERKAQREAK